MAKEGRQYVNQLFFAKTARQSRELPFSPAGMNNSKRAIYGSTQVFPGNRKAKARRDTVSEEGRIISPPADKMEIWRSVVGGNELPIGLQSQEDGHCLQARARPGTSVSKKGRRIRENANERVRQSPARLK